MDQKIQTSINNLTKDISDLEKEKKSLTSRLKTLNIELSIFKNLKQKCEEILWVVIKHT